MLQGKKKQNRQMFHRVIQRIKVAHLLLKHGVYYLAHEHTL